MSAPMEEFKAQQAVLQQQYAARTLDDADEMDALLSDTEKDDGEALDQLRHLAHRLAGGSGVFGLGELSQPAFELETCIDQGADNETVRKKTKVLTALVRQTIENKA